MLLEGEWFLLFREHILIVFQYLKYMKIILTRG